MVVKGRISQSRHTGDTKKAIAMRDNHVAICKRLKWPAMIALLLVSAVPGEARVRVFISPGIVVPFGPFWTPDPAPYAYPYRYPYAPPPVVVQPSPQVYVQPPPPQLMWYDCENPPGLLPLCPTMPRRLAADPRHAAIAGRPAHTASPPNDRADEPTGPRGALPSPRG